MSGGLGCNPTVAAPEFTGTDNCSGDLSSSIIVTTDGPMNTGCAYTQTWTANVSDACGNAADPVSITYTWTVDTEKPVIATTAMSGGLGCNPTVAAPEFTGTDNCSGDLSSSIIVTTDGPMNTGCAYTQTWTANVSDACGNAADPVSITYTWTVDTEKPVIATTAMSGDLGCNPTVAAPEFTGTDNCSGDLSSSIIVTTDGPMNTGCAYTQTWTANVSDACGNAADPVSITYTWTVDTEKPVIATTAMSGGLGCNPTVAAPEFTGTDNCSGDLSSSIIVTTDGPMQRRLRLHADLDGERERRLRQRGGSGEHHLHLDGGYGEAGDRDDGYERRSWLQPDGRGAGIHGHRQLRGHDHAGSDDFRAEQRRLRLHADMGGELHGRLRQRGGSGEHHLHLERR
jgi:hypothetical protein